MPTGPAHDTAGGPHGTHDERPPLAHLGAPGHGPAGADRKSVV